MNEIDKKILSILQVNADIPIAELSKKINLSATPCWARIRSNRYAMLIDNLKVLNIKEEADTAICEASSAENFLKLV